MKLNFTSTCLPQIGFAIFFILIFFPVDVSAHLKSDSTILTGKFYAPGKNGVKIFLTSTDPGFRDTATIYDNGHFRFAFASSEKARVYFIEAGTVYKNYAFPIFLEPGSPLQFNVSKDFRSVDFKGNSGALEQTAYYMGLGKITSDWHAENDRLNRAVSDVEAAAIKRRLESVEKKILIYNRDWVTSHKKSPFSAAVLRLNIFDGKTLERSKLTAQLFHALSAAAKMHNDEADILRAKLASMDDTYSIIPR